MRKTLYVKVDTVASHCPDCNSRTTLLCKRWNQQGSAQFFICWNCRKIFEAGRGEVTTSEY